jgi:hypothetical protein
MAMEGIIMRESLLRDSRASYVYHFSRISGLACRIDDLISFSPKNAGVILPIVDRDVVVVLAVRVDVVVAVS